MSANQTAAYQPAPITQRDGSALANSNCRMASIATGLDYDTRGAKRSTGAKMRSYTDDQSGGTGSDDAKQSWSRGYGESLTVRDGGTFDGLLSDLRAGRLVHIDVWHASAGGPCLSGSGAYGHTMAVLPDCRDGSWLVADPWCSPAKWSRWPESKLRAGAEEWGRRCTREATGGMSTERPNVTAWPALLTAAGKRLMERAYPGHESDEPSPPDTGGAQCLWTVTAALAPEGDMADVVVTDPTALYVDLAEGSDVLNLDGSARTTVKAERAGTFTSPFGSVTGGGTATRAIVWTRSPDPDLLLAAYGNQCTNKRPIATAGADVAEAVAERDAEWVDALTEGWPATP